MERIRSLFRLKDILSQQFRPSSEDFLGLLRSSRKGQQFRKVSRRLRSAPIPELLLRQPSQGLLLSFLHRDILELLPFTLEPLESLANRSSVFLEPPRLRHSPDFQGLRRLVLSVESQVRLLAFLLRPKASADSQVRLLASLLRRNKASADSQALRQAILVFLRRAFLGFRRHLLSSIQDSHSFQAFQVDSQVIRPGRCSLETRSPPLGASRSQQSVASSIP